MLESGVIKSFNSHKDRRFGFITSKSGENIFFHADRFRLLKANNDGTFSFHGSATDRPWPIRTGNIIYFERVRDSQGRNKADPWCFKKHYTDAIERLARRVRYRVRKQVIVYNDPPDKPAKPETLWEGTDIKALMLAYPRTRDRGDSLCPEFSCDEFEDTIWFEEQKPGGGWKKTGDPRQISDDQQTNYV